jgi:hypothetical protein
MRNRTTTLRHFPALTTPTPRSELAAALYDARANLAIEQRSTYSSTRAHRRALRLAAFDVRVCELAYVQALAEGIQ